MDIQRTITIKLPDDADLRATLSAFRDVQNAVTGDAFNGGALVGAVDLQRQVYGRVKGTLNSQMTITALRLVVGAYASVARNRTRRLKAEQRRKKRFLAKGWTYKPCTIKPMGVCRFERMAAMFLVGVRGRDADFRKDGTLAIWTVAGRKRLPYTIIPDHKSLFDAATEINAVTVIERGGHLYGRVALTLDAPEPKGVEPVGIDLNETNALVAVDADGRELFISGLATKVRNRRTMQATRCVQKKVVAKKAEGKSGRSAQRVLKRLSGRRSRRTHDFARVTAKTLVAWVPKDAVLVFEDVQMQQPEKGVTGGVALRRRLSLWQHDAIRQATISKAEMAGTAIAYVNPAYTSKNCSRCGLRGVRTRHRFRCPHCGQVMHADVNAAINIRNRFVQSRLDGPPSVGPVA